ncbi:MAG: hypothetical protein K940chlam2_00888 [Chlamydiae bacterium]|nr:hypothetical protein [Chlamydiota bacterium]
MGKNKHIGSDFDDFLKEEGIYEECSAEAVKRVVAFQIAEEMKKQKLTKTKFAKMLKTSRAAIDRLLDPKKSCSIKSLAMAAAALGKNLEIRMA